MGGCLYVPRTNGGRGEEVVREREREREREGEKERERGWIGGRIREGVSLSKKERENA